MKSNGARLEITFPGVTLGVFAGRLQYHVFKGSNLIRQVVIAKTDQQSVAYKYDGGLKGLPIQPASRVVWRDLAGRWQDQRFGGPVNQDPATVWSSNRLIAADLPGGSIAAFPPPHSFYGARESNQVLGDNYYRKDSDTSFAFGIRQAEKEEDPEFLHNFALDQRAARAPGSRCRCSSTSARNRRRRRWTRRSPSPAAIGSSRCPATRSWGRTITSAWCRGSRNRAASTIASTTSSR